MGEEEEEEQEEEEEEEEEILLWLTVVTWKVLDVLYVSKGKFSLIWDFAVTLEPCRMLQEERFSKTCLTLETFWMQFPLFESRWWKFSAEIQFVVDSDTDTDLSIIGKEQVQLSYHRCQQIL